MAGFPLSMNAIAAQCRALAKLFAEIGQAGGKWQGDAASKSIG
jgi:hypothetical protein